MSATTTMLESAPRGAPDDLAAVLDALADSRLVCLLCADACLAETMDMTQCIRSCLDCADICEAATRLGLRRTGSNDVVLREMLELCARTCDACAAECDSHDHEHCKLCAQICRECADDCRAAALSLVEAA